MDKFTVKLIKITFPKELIKVLCKTLMILYYTFSYIVELLKTFLIYIVNSHSHRRNNQICKCSEESLKE